MSGEVVEEAFEGYPEEEVIDLTEAQEEEVENNSLDENMTFLECLKKKLTYEQLATIVAKHAEAKTASSARPFCEMAVKLYTTGAEGFNGELKSGFEGMDKGEVGDENWEVGKEENV